MDFSPKDADFLAHYQQLLFSDKLEGGSPSEKADVLRHALSQLQFARISGISDESTVSKLMKKYQDKYSSVVDSFDEKTGLNNYAEDALRLCSGHKNESQQWASSLTAESVLKMSCVQQLVKDLKRTKEKVLPSHRRHERLPPSKKTNLQQRINSVDTQPGTFRSERQTTANIAGPMPNVLNNRQIENGDRPPEDTIFNLYNNRDRNYPNQSCGNQENVFNGSHGKTEIYTDNGQQKMNRKPLFGSGGKSNQPAFQNHRPQALYGQNNDNYQQSKRKINDTADDYEMDKPSMAGNPFRTAKQQLAIDNQKKYGGVGGHQNRGSLNTSSYGTGKKSLGPRRGLNSKFVPPVMNREEMDMDGNEAANTITRAVLKTGGNNDSGAAKYEGLDDEKLKGIESKMIELIMNEIMDTGPEMTWDDIAGLEFAKKTIKEIVVWPMLRPDIFTGLRGPPKGLLLFGPPGTGKTLIGKCIASQSKSTFFCISASSLTSKWVGEGEKMVRALFAVARAQQPAVVFIDEIDSLLTQRTDGENEASRRIKTEFLVQLDGASTSSDDRILVIGATNRPQEIDEAARRRFVKRLYIPLPEFNARQTIILNLLKKQSYNLDESQLEKICSRTEGFSGADMATLCREAALGPIRDMSFGDIEHISADQVRPIQFCDFVDALDTVRPSVSDKDLDLYLEWNKTFGSGGR